MGSHVSTSRFQIALLAVWLVSCGVSIAAAACLDAGGVDTVWHFPSDLTTFVIVAIPVALVVSVSLCFLARRLLVMQHNMAVLILIIGALAVAGGVITSGSLLLSESILGQVITPELDMGN